MVAATRQAVGQVAGSRRALLVVDDGGDCVEASLGACSMLGIDRSEVVGRPVADLLERESRQRFAAFWRVFHRGGGRAEPFALEAPAPVVEVGASLTPEILPSRHLITFEALAGRGPVAVAEPGEDAGAGHAPVVEPPAIRAPTAREREVLGLLADGVTDAQIAELLGLSPATVQTHVRNAKAKLGARTRAQAVAMALQLGIIAAV